MMIIIIVTVAFLCTNTVNKTEYCNHQQTIIQSFMMLLIASNDKFTFCPRTELNGKIFKSNFSLSRPLYLSILTISYCSNFSACYRWCNDGLFVHFWFSISLFFFASSSWWFSSLDSRNVGSVVLHHAMQRNFSSHLYCYVHRGGVWFDFCVFNSLFNNIPVDLAARASFPFVAFHFISF